VPITDDVKRGKSKGASSRFLNQLNTLQSTKAWFEFLQNELPEGEVVTVNQMYELYDRFYENDHYLQLLEQDMVSALKKSVIRIGNNLVDPVTLPSFKKEKGRVKIKKYSLRGDSRFVQMAVCNISTRNDYESTDDYAYAEQDAEESLTYSVDVICGHGVSEQNLLAFMAKKHHNIKLVNKVYKDIQLLNTARDPEKPIYLSYTPKDLSLVGGTPNPHAIYYALGVRQPIGSIAINKLTLK